MKRPFQAAALLLVACTKRDPPVPEVMASAPPSSVAPVVPVEAPLPAPVPVSVALFSGDSLVACLDLTSNLVEMFTELARRAAESDASAKFAKAAKGLTAEQLESDDVVGFARGAEATVGEAIPKFQLKLKGEPQLLKQACGAQFAGRAVISACALEGHKRLGRDGGAGFDLHVQLRVSFYGVTGDDRWMRACLTAAGEWNELPHDSLEYTRADHLRLYNELKGQ